MPIKIRLLQAFERRFGGPPAQVVRAPGRVNLIGGHTDYNDGFVLPMAIDRAVWLAVRPRQDRSIWLWSLDFDQEAGFHLDTLARAGQAWIEYPKGVAWALLEAGHRLRGLEGVVSGDVPVAAGLSSSAALELATARAFTAVADIPWDPVAMAEIGRRAENEWLGVQTGIMDQLICALGQREHALFLDCRTRAGEQVPLPPSARVFILDTGTRRGLVDSAYNEHRAQCQTAADHFGVAALRDVSPSVFASRARELEPLIRRRARHVIGENQRVREAAAALRQGDAARMGALMNASHASLRDNFEVSSPALDAITAIAREHSGTFGARMTGAGFGGCAVALVDANAVQDFPTRVGSAYLEVTGLTPEIYSVEASPGASDA